MVQRIEHEIEFSTFLSSQILDRNLYERANDARWWALTEQFSDFLAHPAKDSLAQERVGKTLNYINQLYTIHTGLILYDCHGVIQQVSKPELARFIGQPFADPDSVKKCLQLTSSEAYHVSDFCPTPYYQHQPTYLYHAAIRAADRQKVVGGIALVFDAKSQLESILNDTLPSFMALSEPTDLFSVFVDQNRQVLASTAAEQFPVGSKMDLPRLENITGTVTLTIHGQRYLAGYHKTQGYREFKKKWMATTMAWCHFLW